MVRQAKKQNILVHTTSSTNPRTHNVHHATQHRVTSSSILIDTPATGSSQRTAPVESLLKQPEPAVVSDEPGQEPGGIAFSRKRYENSDSPVRTWSSGHRDEYLDHILVLEGRGRMHANEGKCARCTSECASFRCKMCWGLRVVCRSCLVKTHVDEPLHHIEEWKNGYFQPTTLKTLKVRYQLGHRPGQRCAFPKAGYEEFVVLHWNGIHIVNLDFCGCSGLAHHLQILEAGWWPASFKDPRTAASLELLRNFHITNLQSQIPPTDFYRSLVQMTDGTGLLELPDRESQWMLILREYRHIKMMKRCGRSHDPEGIAKTALGSAAVVCRACPHPDRNLPPGWRNAPKDDRFLYALFLSEDANFKQKARARPNDSRDPSLSPGWGCFVSHDEYITEVRKHADQREISRCQSFKAIGDANSKKARGLRATGIGSVSCARHETFLPNGMGDLQKGERFVNMDYIALAALMGCQLLMVVFSYDIACQWMINFFFRMADFPEHMHLPLDLDILFKIPKWHLIAHILRCLAPFSFGFTEGVGKTDGEAPERCWSWLNTIARSVSMMTAGARWDTMDDFANAWNYKKMLNLEFSLVKKMGKAIPEAVVNVRVFSAFTEALKVDHAADLKTWEEQVVRWEQGIEKFCPYEVKEPKISLAKVKKKLADDEQRREEKGERSAMSELITEGVDIEEAQPMFVRRALTVALTKKTPTTLQEKNNQQKRTSLLKRIRKHRQAMVAHMPLLQRLIDRLPTKESSTPEKMTLLLPSTLTPTERSLIYPPELIEAEDQLRFGQCYDSLARLRLQLQARHVAYKDTSRLTPSQGLYTRTQTLRNQIEAKVKACSATYRESRKALLAIRGEGPWTNILKELRDDDIRGITERTLKRKEREDWEEAQEIAGVSEEAIDEVLNDRSVPTLEINPIHMIGQSKQHLSWIWYTHQSFAEGEVPDTFEEVKDNLRAEWCKARAASRRPREELRLVEEEMRRSIQYCHWQAAWWTEQATRRTDISPWLKEGLEAYAKEQCNTETRRAIRWSGCWAPIRERAKEILKYVSDPAFQGDLPLLESLEIKLSLDDDDEADVVFDDLDLEDIDE
ncbi:hypothetical protein V5O48_005839 [Marasmius crinis-equi]|uniref:CxC2-like cysteine cluster KDZ transposase-associated domain-containing protein n=1 Tax=Marasmius crinis-equi TaxID=585013 RepID=A0ABR3FL66_9AGAR